MFNELYRFVYVQNKIFLVPLFHCKFLVIIFKTKNKYKVTNQIYKIFGLKKKLENKKKKVNLINFLGTRIFICFEKLIRTCQILTLIIDLIFFQLLQCNNIFQYRI